MGIIKQDNPENLPAGHLSASVLQTRLAWQDANSSEEDGRSVKAQLSALGGHVTFGRTRGYFFGMLLKYSLTVGTSCLVSH